MIGVNYRCRDGDKSVESRPDCQYRSVIVPLLHLKHLTRIHMINFVFTNFTKNNKVIVLQNVFINIFKGN